MDASTALFASIETRADELDHQSVGGWHRRTLALLGFAAFLGLYELFLGTTLAEALTQAWTLGPEATHAVASSGFVGMFLGAISVGILADRRGRRPALLTCAGIYAVFTFASAAAPDVTMLVILRFVAGFGIGAQLPIVDTYAAEILPRNARGRYLSLIYAGGFLAAPVVVFLGGRYVADGHWIVAGWRWMLVFAAVLSIVLLHLARNLDESPRWMLGDATLLEAQDLPPWQAVFAWRHRLRSLTVAAVHVLRAAAYGGFLVVGPEILVSKGFPIVNSVGYSAASLLCLPLGALLIAGVAERYERKVLVITSAICTGLFGVVFGTAADSGLIVGAGCLLMLSIGALAASVHIYQSEIFPTSLRATASSATWAVFVAGLAVIPFVADPIVNRIGSGSVFVGSAGLIAALCLLVSATGPASTGRSLDRL